MLYWLLDQIRQACGLRHQVSCIESQVCGVGLGCICLATTGDPNVCAAVLAAHSLAAGNDGHREDLPAGQVRTHDAN